MRVLVPLLRRCPHGLDIDVCITCVKAREESKSRPRNSDYYLNHWKPGWKERNGYK